MWKYYIIKWAYNWKGREVLREKLPELEKIQPVRYENVSGKVIELLDALFGNKK